MTPIEAFEIWLNKKCDGKVALSLQDVWLAACAWQLEKDVKVAKECLGGNSTGERIATAIRGGTE